MKKVDRISVVSARFGSDPEKLEVPKDSTVDDVLDEAGVNLSSSEKVWINGEKATRKDLVEDGDNVLIVSPKQAGS